MVAPKACCSAEGRTALGLRAAVEKAPLLFASQAAEPGARGAAVAGARRPIAQAKISSETAARIIGGASFYVPQHSHPCVACQLTR